ncbi:MAG: hypothetical protein WBA39_23465, partial [Rivularia sp. (in: cyanobacteria)]
MTGKITGYIIIPCFSIWLALSNQIASAKIINPLLEQKDESSSELKSHEKKYVLISENFIRKKLRAKFKNYISDTHNLLEEKKSYEKILDVDKKNIRKGELIADAINELNNQSSKSSEKESLRALPLINRLAEHSKKKPLEKLSPIKKK